MSKKKREFIVKLEYSLFAWSEKDAVDFLLRTMRMAANQDPDRGVAILRTDVRQPGEIGDW
jgi:hypothetical protein